MKHNRVFPIWALALALGLSCGALTLTACNSGGTDEAPQAEGAQKETEAADNTGEDTTDTEDQTDQTPAQDEAVWVVTREVESYRTADMESDVEILYELDEHGNAVKMTQSAGEGLETYTATITVDEDGYVVKTGDNLDDGTALTYTLEKDSQGRLVKSTGSDGTVEETSYNDAGNIAKRVVTGNVMGEDPDGNWTVTGTYTSTTTYDEAGHVVSIFSENNGYYQLMEKTYEYNEAGQIVSVTNKNYGGADPDNLESEASVATASTVEYDENGNVARVVEEGEMYSYVITYEYALVEHPSLAARQNAHTLYL